LPDVDGQEQSHQTPAFLPVSGGRAFIGAAALAPSSCIACPRIGVKVAADVFESPASVVFDLAENRLHTRRLLLMRFLTLVANLKRSPHKIEWRP
jgi:ornithine carbamoyltransferase